MKIKHNYYIFAIAYLLFLGMSAESVYLISKNSITLPNFYETVLLQTNSVNKILFNLSSIVLLFSFYAKHENSAARELKNIISNILLLVGTFITANIIYSVMSVGFTKAFANQWTFASEMKMSGITPFKNFAISIVLISMRYIFSLYLCYLINKLTHNNHWGFWSIIVINLIDYNFYALVQIPYPLKILPIEHTRTVYTSAYFPDLDGVMRFSYYLSFLYWFFLILLIYIILKIIDKKRSVI